MQTSCKRQVLRATQWLLVKLPSFWFLHCVEVRSSCVADKPTIFIFRSDELVDVNTGVTPQGEKKFSYIRQFEVA
jgi:hypothetical protein